MPGPIFGPSPALASIILGQLFTSSLYLPEEYSEPPMIGQPKYANDRMGHLSRREKEEELLLQREDIVGAG